MASVWMLSGGVAQLSTANVNSIGILAGLWTEPGVSEFVAAVVGAVVGSLSGGIISWLLQRAAFNQEQHKRSLEKKATDRALLLQMFYAAIQAASDLGKLAEDTDTAAARAKEFKNPPVPGVSMMWAALQPAANLPEPISIRPEALTVFVDHREAGLAMQVMDVQAIHHSAMKMWTVYGDSYRRFGEKVTFDFDEDGTPYFALDRSELGKIYPHLKELSDLAASICSMGRDHATKTKALVTELLPFIERVAGTKLDVEFRV